MRSLMTLSLLLGLAILANLAAAQDKSATRDSLIKLPSAGGTVYSEQSEFTFNRNRGSASYRVALPELPVRAGFGPGIHLVYGQAQGNESGLGIGWRFELPVITFGNENGSVIRGRNFKGDFPNWLSFNGRKLVHFKTESCGDLHYKPESEEQDLHIVFKQSGLMNRAVNLPSSTIVSRGFEVRYPDGRRQFFSGELNHPEAPAEGDVSADNSEHVVTFPLAYEISTTDETIAYRYLKSGGRSYLREVVFAGGLSRYEFSFIDAINRNENYSKGFRQTASKLYSNLRAFYNGNLREQFCFAYHGLDDAGQSKILASSTCLTEANNNASVQLASHNLTEELRAVYRFGSDSNLISTTLRHPTVYFQYSDWKSQDMTLQTAPYTFAANSFNELTPDLIDRMELVDFNNDSLIDIVGHGNIGGETKTWILTGKGNLSDSYLLNERQPWALTDNNNAAFYPDFSSNNYHFADMNGDGYSDVVQFVTSAQTQNVINVYLASSSGFQFSRSFQFPSDSLITAQQFASGNFQFVDLNLDGRSDIIGTRLNAERSEWWICRNKSKVISNQFTPRFECGGSPLPYNTTTDTLLSTRFHRLIDMNGDRLPDYVRIAGENICIYMNRGTIHGGAKNPLLFGSESSNGSCGSGLYFSTSGIVDTNEFSSLSDLQFSDVNGDGIADMFGFVPSNTMKVWLGRGDGRFLNVADTIRLATNVDNSSSKIRMSDIDSDGQQEILVFNPSTVAKPLFIDFNRIVKQGVEMQLVKPNLLTRIEYSSGKRYDLTYSTSVDEMLRDSATAPSKIHFPMALVKQIAESEGTYAGTRDFVKVTEMLYSTPYYDPVAKDFLGFEQVLSINYGDDYVNNTSATQQSQISREVFYTGRTQSSERLLAGRLKESSIFAFVPGADYSGEAERSQTIEAAASNSLSKSTYTRLQKVPNFSGQTPLQTSLSQWKIVPRNIANARIPIYYSRLEGQTTALYNSSSTPIVSRNYNYDFDQFNIANNSIQCSSGHPAVAEAYIPVEAKRTVEDYGDSRASLQTLGIVNKPSNRKVYKLAVGSSCPVNLQTLANETLLDSVGWTYSTDHGQVLTENREIISSIDPQNEPSKLSGVLSAAPNFVLLSYDYDSWGNLQQLTRNDVRQDSVTYDSNGVLPLIHNNAMSHRTEFRYRDDGRILSVIDPRGESFSFSYDRLGRRTNWKQSTGAEQNYFYQQPLSGKPQMILTQLRRYSSSASTPAGESEFIQRLDVYNTFGILLANLEASEDNGSRILDYSELNRNRKVVFRWTPYESPQTLQSIFDNQQVPVPTGSRVGTLYKYDGLDRVTKETYPSGLEITRVYEAWGQIINQSYPSLASTIQSCRKIISHMDVIYGVQDELACAAGTGVHLFSRDSRGKLKEIKLAGQTSPRLLFFDNLGRLELEKIPEAGAFYYLYDAQGNNSLSIRFGTDSLFSSAHESVFDALGRPRETAVYDGSGDNLGNMKVVQRFAYDQYEGAAPNGAISNPLGLLIKASSVNEKDSSLDYTETISYNRFGLPSARYIQLNGQGFNESYAYTLDSVLRTLTDPYGTQTRYSLTPSMKIRSVHMNIPRWDGDQAAEKAIIQSVAYNAKGQIERIDYHSGGAYTQLSYDPATLQLNQIVSQSSSAPTIQVSGNPVTPLALQDLRLAYDGLGSLLSIEDNLGHGSWGRANRSGTFAYNLRDELIQANRYGATLQYDYDGAGQFRRNDDREPGIVTANTGNLLPDSSAAMPYAFDVNGNLETGGKVINTEFDAFGRLVYTKSQSGIEAIYGYNTAGQRVSKKVIDGSTSSIVLYPTKQVSYEPNATESFVFVGNERIARVEHQKKDWYYYLKDHLGSSDIIMNSQNLPVEQMLYKPYGSEYDPKLVASTGPAWASFTASPDLVAAIPLEATRHRYTGQYLDPETGLYYYGARYYDPKLGRFVSPDNLFIRNPENCASSPIECNLYSYGGNNPLKFIDIDGNEITVRSSTANGVTHVAINFTARLTNESNLSTSANELKNIADRIKHGIEKDFSGSTANMKVKTKVDISTSGDLGSRHSIRLVDTVDKNPFVAGRVNEIGGKDIQLRANITQSLRLERTSAHEFGHAAGLKHTHPDGNNIKSEQLTTAQKDNLMSQTRFSDSHRITSGQISQIKERFSNENTGK